MPKNPGAIGLGCTHAESAENAGLVLSYVRFLLVTRLGDHSQRCRLIFGPDASIACTVPLVISRSPSGSVGSTREPFLAAMTSVSLGPGPMRFTTGEAKILPGLGTARTASAATIRLVTGPIRLSLPSLGTVLYSVIRILPPEPDGKMRSSLPSSLPKRTQLPPPT
ncbi:MAG: hypothetical protein C4340_03305 [Armatimonadota bacterium]